MNRFKRVKEFIDSFRDDPNTTEDQRDIAIARSMAAQNSAGMVLLLARTEIAPVAEPDAQL